MLPMQNVSAGACCQVSGEWQTLSVVGHVAAPPDVFSYIRFRGSRRSRLRMRRDHKTRTVSACHKIDVDVIYFYKVLYFICLYGW